MITRDFIQLLNETRTNRSFQIVILIKFCRELFKCIYLNMRSGVHEDDISDRHLSQYLWLWNQKFDYNDIFPTAQSSLLHSIWYILLNRSPNWQTKWFDVKWIQRKTRNWWIYHIYIYNMLWERNHYTVGNHSLCHILPRYNNLCTLHMWFRTRIYYICICIFLLPRCLYWATPMYVCWTYLPILTKLIYKEQAICICHTG